MSFDHERSTGAESKTAFERLRELLAVNHGVVLPELSTVPTHEWSGDPSKLAIFDDDKHYPVKESN